MGLALTGISGLIALVATSPPPPPTAPSITSGSSGSIPDDGSESIQFAATGDPPITWSTPGTPGGASLTSDGVLSVDGSLGDGSYTFEVDATNGVGSDSVLYTLNVVAPSPPPSVPHSIVTDGVSQYFVADADGTALTEGTIAFWVKPVALAPFLQWASVVEDGSPFLMCNPANGRWYFNQNYQILIGTVPLNAWSMLAFTFQNQAGSVTAIQSYLNGVKVDFNLALAGHIPVNDPDSVHATKIWLGNGYNAYSQAKFSWLALFVEALGDTDIANLYAAGSAADPAGFNVLGWWNFLEGTGTSVSRFTNAGSSANGSLVNGPTWDTDVP